MPRRTKKQFIKRPFILGVIAILLAGGLYWAFFRESKNTSQPTDTTGGSSYVNLDPPTDQEKQETEAYKKQLAEQGDTPAPTATSEKKKVTPVITIATTERVTAYVSGIFEDGGICTATFAKGDQVVVKTSKGFENASYTTCNPINPGEQVNGAGWSVIVSYNSATAEGKSQSMQVKDN